MRVEAVDRIDERTLLCRIAWDSPDREILRIFVRVEASVNEYSFPLRHGDDFVLRDAPPALPEGIQRRAVQAAQRLAGRFAQIEV